MICQPAPISLHQYKLGKSSFFDKSLNTVSSNSSFPLCRAFSTSFVTSLDAISKPNSVSSKSLKSSQYCRRMPYSLRFAVVTVRRKMVLGQSKAKIIKIILLPTYPPLSFSCFVQSVSVISTGSGHFEVV